MTATANRSKTSRRTQIVEAARTRFRATGLDDTTLDMIAQDAGVQRPHLYRYFADKADLVAAVVAAEAAEVNRRRAERIESVDDFVEQIVVGISTAVELVHSDPFWSSLVSPTNIPYTAYVAVEDPELTSSNRDFWHPILHRARERGDLRAGVDLDETMAWILGVEFLFLERREFFPSHEAAAHYVRTYVVPALVDAG